MTYRGTVKGNVVVLEPGAKLPDGATVHVETEAASTGGPVGRDEALFQMADLAVETGIPDLATNADHYLYGHPKLGHAQ